MRDEEKIIQVKTFEDFERELGRGGEETLEVPAWIAEQYSLFPEDAGRRTRRSGAEGGSGKALGPAWRGEEDGSSRCFFPRPRSNFLGLPFAAISYHTFPEVGADSATLLNKAPRAELQPACSDDATEFSAWGNRHGKLSPRSLIVFAGLLREGKYGPDQL